MAAYTNLTLSDMIEEALGHLYRAAETPHEVAIAAAALSDKDDTSFDLSSADSATVNITDILEAPNGELMLVTAKSSNTFTVNRGFHGTSAAAKGWDQGTLLKKNPTWERYKVRQWIERFFSGIAFKHLPYVTDETVNVVAGTKHAELPAGVLKVYQVSFLDPWDSAGDFVEYQGWTEHYNLPSTASSTGALIRFPDRLPNDLDIFLTVLKKYEWSSSDATTETQTVPCPVGAEDLPALYAAMGMASRRPLSSIALDKAVEFSEDEPTRRNMELQLFKLLRGEFYARLEEAKHHHTVPRTRTFRSMGGLRRRYC